MYQIRVFFILLVAFSVTSVAVAQYSEKISSLKDGPLGNDYLLASEAIQVFTANAPHIHKMLFRTFSEGELLVSFYRAENSFGQYKLIDENNRLFSKKIQVRPEALSELSLPDSLIFNVGRKYFIRISSIEPFIIYVKNGSFNGQQLYLDNGLIPDKTLDFELHTGYGRKRRINSVFQTAAVFWDDGFMKTNIDSAGIQPDGIVFKADVTFLKSMSLDLSISASAEGEAELFEFDIKQKKPIYHSKVSCALKIAQDTSGRALIDWEKEKRELPFLEVGKYYFLSWKFHDGYKINLRNKRTSSIYKYNPKDLSVSCIVKGHDYYTENVKESIAHPVIEADTMVHFLYRPSMAYVNTIVVRNSYESKGLLNVYKEDTSGRVLIYTLKFEKRNNLGEIHVRSAYTLNFDIGGKYLIELAYDSAVKKYQAYRKDSTSLELYGCNKFNDEISRINATKLAEPYAENIAQRLKILCAHDINWLCIDVPEQPSDKFISEVEWVQHETEPYQMGLILNVRLDLQDSIAAEKDLNVLEKIARKNISKKIIFNFYSRSYDLHSYTAYRSLLKNITGRLRMIEKNFILSETLHDSLTSASWKTIFHKHFVPLQLFTLNKIYDEERCHSLRRLVMDAHSEKDGTIQPRILFDFSTLKENTFWNNSSFVKVYDNYVRDSLIPLTDKVFIIPVSLEQSIKEELSEMLIRLKATFCGSLEKPLPLDISIIQKDTIKHSFILSTIDKDSIIKLRFFLPSDFSINDRFIVKVEFERAITLYGITYDKGVEMSSSVLPCTYIGVRSKEYSLIPNKQVSVKMNAIGQPFVCEQQMIQSIIVYCDQQYRNEITLSLYEFVNSASPRGKPLLVGLLPRSDVDIDRCNFYNIDMSNFQIGKKYYLEFSRNGRNIETTFVNDKSGAGSLPFRVIYSYVDEDGVLHIPSVYDDSLNNSLHYAEVFSERLIERSVLQQQLGGVAGYILSRDIAGTNRWHDKDNYGLMIPSASGDSALRVKRYVSMFYGINSFFKDCEVSAWPSIIKADKKDYVQTVFYHRDSNEIRIAIWNKHNYSPFPLEDVLNLQWTMPDFIKSVNILNKSKQFIETRNSFDVVMRGKPLFVVLKLMDGYAQE